MNKNKWLEPAKKVGVLLFWLAAWQGLAMWANHGLLFQLPTPLSTAGALVTLAGKAELYQSAGLSLLRIAIGYAAAVVVGIVGALIARRFSVFDRLTRPLLNAVRAVPVASFIVLVFLWFAAEVIPVLISFLMVLPIVWQNTRTAIDQIDTRLVEMAGVMNLKKSKIWRYIIWPAVLPTLSAALTTGLGFAWKAGVSAEVICRTVPSLGNMLWASKNALAYDEVFATTAVIVIFSMILEWVVRALVRRGNQ